MARPPNQLGRRVRDWRVVAIVGRATRGPLYEIACVRCDRRRQLAARQFPTIGPCSCDVARPELEPALTGPLIDHWTPWEADDRCWYVVAHHPAGLSLREVGELMGISYEGVRLLAEGALRKLREEHPDVLRRMLAELEDGDEEPDALPGLYGEPSENVA